MELNEILVAIQNAIASKRYIHLRMHDTPVDRTIVVEPYALMDDALTGRPELFLYIAQHYAHDDHFYHISILTGASHVSIGAPFVPKENWYQQLEPTLVNRPKDINYRIE